MMMAIELYLEGVPASDMHLEMLRRAIDRDAAKIGNAEALLAHLRQKHAGRALEYARQLQRLHGAKPEGKASAGPSTGSDAPAPGGAKPDETPLTPAVVAHLRDWCLRSLQGEISAPRPGGQEKEGA